MRGLRSKVYDGRNPGIRMTCYVYVLRTENGNGRFTTYVGWTMDLGRRLAQHNGGRGAKFTRGRRWSLVYAEKHKGKRQAMAREHALKNDRKFRAELRAR